MPFVCGRQCLPLPWGPHRNSPSANCRKSPKLLGAFLAEKEQKKAVFGGSSIYRTSSPFISQYIFRKISARTFRKCMGLQVLDQI